MTVSELIDLLFKCDQNAEVLIRDYWNTEYEDCQRVETVEEAEGLCILILE